MPLIWLISVTLGFGVQTSCPSAASQAAKERYARGDSAGAIAALADVEICTDGSEVELAEALRWRAQAKAAAGDAAGSIEAWALTWTVLPTYVLDPLESPKFHDLYAQGRTRAATGRSVFARITRTIAGHVVVQVFDPTNRIKRVNVAFDQMEMHAVRHDDGTWHALVPEGARSASAVLETGDATIFRSLKLMLNELPTPVDERIAARVEPVDRKKWIIIGAAAGGAVVIAAVITAIALGARRIDGSLGRVELP